MASLAHCVDLHKTLFPKEEMVALRSESRRLAMEKKIKPKEAMIQVVRSHIAETQADYDEIVSVIEKHYKAAKKPEAKPIKPVEEKVIRPIIEATDREVISGILKKAMRTGLKSDKGAWKLTEAIAAMEETKIAGEHMAEAVQYLATEDAKDGWIEDEVDALRAVIASEKIDKTARLRATKILKSLTPEVKPKEAISHLELTKRYVEETGEKVEKGELDKVKERYPEEWARIEKAETHKKELWNKLPESFRRNRGISEYTTKELEAMVAEKPEKEPAKEPWETSDLADKPNIRASMVQAKKQPDGKYKLFFTGTRNEVFEGKTFASAPEARSFFKVQQVKAQEAAGIKPAKEPAKKPVVTKKVAGQRSNKEGVEFYNPFNVKTRNKIIEGKPNFAGVVKQGYRDGFFTQGHYAVKLPEAPETKGPLLLGDEAPDVKEVIPTEDITSAFLIGEFKPEGSDVTLLHAMAPGNQDCFFNAAYVDLILTRYPDAKLSLGPMVYEARLGVFTVGKDVVGLVMSVNVDVSNFLEKIQQIKTKDDIKFSVAEEKDLVAYHNLTGQNLIDADDLGGMPMPSLAITKKDFPYEPFGDITMIGSKGMVDPEGTFNRVFDADTYSPTVPSKERDLKRKPFDELWNRLSSKIADVGDYIYSLTEAAEKGYDALLHFFDNSNGMKVAFLREQGIPIRLPMRDIGFEMPFSDTEAVQTFVREYKGKISDIKLHSPEHKAASDAIMAGMDEEIKRAFVDTPERIEVTRKATIENWFDKEGYATWGLAMARLERDAKLILKPGKEKVAIDYGIISRIDKSALRVLLEKKFTKKITTDYLEWTKKQIEPLYGDPYLKLGRKKVPYTLANVFEAMHRQSIKASQDLMTFGPGKARAMGAKEFRTLAEVRKHKASLVHHDKFQELKEEQDKKRENLTDALAKYYQYKDWRGEVDVWASIDDSMKAVGIFLKSPVSKQTPGLMRGCLGRRGFKNVPAYILKDVTEFAKTLRDMPTEYFEVKPERVVSIGEFSGAALPKNVDPAVKKILKKHGVPFKIYKTEEERQVATQSFQRKRDVLFSVQPMYSALTRAAEAPKFPANIPAKSVINQLKKASGVKQVELDVVGLSEWLEGKDKILKTDLVDFLRLNEVRVEEVEKGTEDLDAIADRAAELFDEAVSERIAEIEEETGEEPDRDDVSNSMSYGDYYEEAEREIGEKEEVKFAEHVLPGGEPGSYRELVLRVPDRYQAFPDFAEWASMDESAYHKLSKEEQGRLESQYNAAKDKALTERYVSPHWDEPNIVAHIRGDVRTSPDGKRLFHVAEFQSDIYSRIVELEAMEEPLPGIGWQLFYADGTALGGTYVRKEHAEAEMDAMNEGRTTSLLTIERVEGVKDTRNAKELANLKKLFPWGERWHELVAKKALEYAVKNDLDGISWDIARTQVDRWESALRKSVDRIEWEKTQAIKGYVTINASKADKKPFEETIPLQGETTISGQKVTLNNLIGKELATKIRESSETSGSFESKDLTIGGEFYKIIYDQKIPGFLKKYGKKWGATISKKEVPTPTTMTDEKTGTEYTRQHEKPIMGHAMDITPDMREAIQTSGQALFAERAAPGKKLTVDTARAEIADRIGEKALNAMIGAKKIQFVTLDEVTEIIGYVRESKDQGFYKDGIVYLIPQNIGEGKAWGVLMHELGVHLGYNKIFGEKLAKRVFASFVANKDKKTPLGLAVSQAMRRVPRRTPPDLVNEEAVAYFTEEHANIDLPLHRKIIARMRLWAVKYFGVKPDIFVMADYVALAASSMRGEIREVRRAPVREGVSREVFYSERGKDFVFETDCVSCDDVEALEEMIGKGKDVTYNTFIKNVGTEGLQNMFPQYDWGPGKGVGLRLKDDYTVSFNKSTYQGYPCYYVVHSAIEYIFVNREAALSKKEQKMQRERWDYEAYVDSVLAKRGIGRDVRFSVVEQKDLRTWADDLIKSAKDDSFILDTQKTSPEEIRESSFKILADLNLKKLNQPARSVLEGMSPKGKGLGATVEKWLASPEWYQHPVLKKIVGHALDKSEKFHTTFNEFNAVDDPFAEHDTVAKTLEALARKGKISKAAFILGRTSSDFKKLETLLDDADVYGEKHTVEELKEKGYSEDVIQAWTVVRESYDKQLEALIKPMKDLVARIKEQAAFMGTEPVYPDFGDFIIEGKKRRLTLQEAVMEMGRYKGTYSPRIRDRGAWVVTGKKEGVVVEGGDEWVRYNRKTKSFANLLRDKLTKEGFTDIKVEKESRLPEETFQAIRLAEMGTMIGHAATKGFDRYDGEQQMAFMDEIVTASADMIKSRGARATMIRRREGLAVRGYLTDPLKRFVRYTGTNAAGIAKAEMAERMIKDLYGEYRDGKKVGGIDATKEGDVHSMARAYIEEQLRNAEAGDRIVGIMKALTTFKFLGFNPRSVLVNLSSLTTSVPMSLLTYIMDGKGSIIRIGKVLSGGCKDYTKVMAGKRLKDIDEQIFIDEFKDAGYTDAQYTRDAMGNVQGAYGTVWSKLMGGSMWVFGKSEEWVRGGTALAAFRLAKKQGLSNTKAKEKAIFATAKAHGTYGKETLPMVAWGKGVGRLGQAFYTYMKFPHNYLQMLYDTGVRKKNIKAAIFGMAAPAVLGGIAAVPMYSTVMAIANMLLSLIGDDRDAEKLVYDTINEHMGKGLEETVRGGMLGLLDLDISGSLSMGPGSVPVSLFELTGAVGGMAQDIYRGVGYAIEGEPLRAFEKLMPKVIGNIAIAIRETREGATTSRGARVWDEEGRPYMPEPSETIKRGFGFRSARRALLAQSTWVSKREERRFKETQSGIYRKIKYLTAGAENVIIDKETADKISEYNKNALQTSNVALITPASIQRQMEKMKVPTTKQKARVTGCERATMFEGDIWAGALGVTDEIDRTQGEIKRLSDTGILKYSAPPSRNINAGYGVEVKLDDDQYSKYVADTSAIIKGAVDRLVHRPGWQEWNDKQKAFIIKRVINEGRKIVRDRLKITILKARLKRSK